MRFNLNCMAKAMNVKRFMNLRLEIPGDTAR